MFTRKQNSIILGEQIGVPIGILAGIGIGLALHFLFAMPLYICLLAGIVSPFAIAGLILFASYGIASIMNKIEGAKEEGDDCWFPLSFFKTLEAIGRSYDEELERLKKEHFEKFKKQAEEKSKCFSEKPHQTVDELFADMDKPTMCQGDRKLYEALKRAEPIIMGAAPPSLTH